MNARSEKSIAANARFFSKNLSPDLSQSRQNWNKWFTYRDAQKIALAPGETVMDLLADTRGE